MVVGMGSDAREIVYVRESASGTKRTHGGRNIKEKQGFSSRSGKRRMGGVHTRVYFSYDLCWVTFPRRDQYNPYSWCIGTQCGRAQ